VVAEDMLNTSRWPLLVARFPPVATRESLADFYSQWQRETEARGRHGVIVDFAGFNPVFASPVLRKLAAEEVERRRAMFDRYLLAEARVVRDPLTRGIVTAFDWLVGNSFARPKRIVGEFAEAEAWIVRELRRLGYAVPPAG
jgi:hypothetical protein